MDDPPDDPPDDLFPSREAAQQVLQQWAKQRIFAVVFDRTKKDPESQYRKQ